MSRGRRRERISRACGAVRFSLTSPGTSSESIRCNRLTVCTRWLISSARRSVSIRKHLQVAVVGQHPQTLGADRHGRDRVRVVGVGLAVVAGVEQPSPGRQLRRDVDHPLTVGEQPLSQRPTGAATAFDGPHPIRPGGDVLLHCGVAGLVRVEPAASQDCLSRVDDLDGGRQFVGIDPDEHLHLRSRLRVAADVDARRALLLRAGQSPLEPHLNAVVDGDAARKRATPRVWVGSRKESAPPTTWTESGRTPVLRESSSSREEPAGSRPRHTAACGRGQTGVASVGWSASPRRRRAGWRPGP